MTQTCLDKFLDEEINHGYKHDAFFDTYCDDNSVSKNWIYTIKDEDFNVYMGYLFIKDKCEYIIPRIIPTNKKFHICKLHNEIELKNEELISELQIENMSNDDNNETTNVCWENRIIRS